MITGFICTVACWPSRRYTSGEFESLAVASRRARHRWRMFELLLRRLRLRQKKVGVGLLRPYRGQTCCVMRGAMARIAPVRPATPPNGPTAKFSRDRPTCIIFLATRILENAVFRLGVGGRDAPPPPDRQIRRLVSPGHPRRFNVSLSPALQ
jgi:hypothetical protein